ncbi:MAG: hypothetical protein NY202_02505 [Mollicutes bacterium UO1]
MVNELAQNYLNTHYSNAVGNYSVAVIDNSNKAAATDKLTGKLVIENYLELTTIKLDDNELTEVVIRNCPELKKINFNSNKKIEKIKLDEVDLTGKNKIDVFSCLDNSELRTLSLKNCGSLTELSIKGCKNLAKIKGLEDADSISDLFATGVPIRHILQEKLKGYQEAKEAIKEIVDLTDDGKPDSVKTNGKLDKDKLKTELAGKINSQVPQLKTDKEQAEKEANEAKAKLEAQKDYDDIKRERDQLQQQLAAIRNELVLAENSTNQQIIDKIKELQNRPTSTCSHADYHIIKAERDRLKTENANLKNDNKDNSDKINAESLKQSTKNLFETLNIDSRETKNASSAIQVETVRNEVISSEFSRLKEKSNSADNLNIGLGISTIGSLLILG